MTTTDTLIIDQSDRHRLGAATDLERSVALRRGELDTRVSRPVAMGMSVLFVLGCLSVPLLQMGVELNRSGRVQALEVLRQRPNARNLHEFEGNLEEASIVKAKIQPRLQHVTTAWLGAGSTTVILGRDGWRPNGWLFFHLGNEYLYGPGFLDPAALRQRTIQWNRGQNNDGGTDLNPQLDPRPAIIQFHRDCEKAGVRLVFVPIPVKPMLQPAQLTGRLAFEGRRAVLNNPDYARFVKDLRDGGVDVFDPTPAHIEAGEAPRFLEQDTHWTPQWMESVAKELADHVMDRVKLDPRPFEVLVEPREVKRVGDIVDNLNLPSGQSLFKPQPVIIHRVLDASTREPLQADESADIVFFGDSFSNIYTAPEMGWGDSAGFPEQVSRFLGRPLDKIVMNGDSATGVRRAFAARDDPMRGKKVIIWQVAMHELIVSKWTVVPIDHE